MARKGNVRHVKRYNLPKYVQIHRKEKVFFMKSRPGAHAKDYSLPLGHALRDLLGFCQTMKEVKFVLNNGKVLVDGKIRKDPRYPVGLMDVIEIPEINTYYRILPSKKHVLMVSEITKEEAQFKLCKIINMTTIRGGNLQLNLHDGRNIVVEVKDATKVPKIKYKTNGTLKISLPDQKIMEFYPLEEGNEVIIFKGTNVGNAGKLTKVVKRFGVKASIASVKDIDTSLDYIFVLGKNSPSIDLPIETE